MHKVNTPFGGTKMAKIRNNSIVILLLLTIVCVQCSLATKFQPNYIDFEQIKHDLYAIRDFNISNVIREISSDKNWSGNRECLLELTAIRDGFDEFDEWAVKRKKCFIFLTYFKWPYVNSYCRLLHFQLWTHGENFHLGS